LVETEVKHIISLGAGVQSSTMALMAAAGEITPMPDCAIFADTQSEPHAVYEHLLWLVKQLPFPIYNVTAGSLRDEILAATRGEQRMDARPPFFLSTGGMLRRQCTQDYKLLPIQRKQRELIGLSRGQHWPKEAVIEQWIGISADEEQRAKESRIAAVRNRWPLIDLHMTREDCLRWLRSKGHPIPAKSACTFCPYHDNALWRDMKANDLASWADAVRVDNAIRNGVKNRKNKLPLSSAKWFVHRDLVPLAEVDLRNAEDAGQQRMFDEHGFAVECEGMCGV
jgi:hypothetical protein